MASPRKARAPRAWPRRRSRVPGTASCSTRACIQARARTCGECHVLCDHERPSQPGHPRAGYAPSRRLPVPTQNALTKLPRARAAPRPRPTLGDTGPRLPAPAPNQPPTIQNTLLQPLHGHRRPHAGATQSQAARPRVRAPLALGPRPRPDPGQRLSPHASHRPPPRSLSPRPAPRSPRHPFSLRGPASGTATSRP